MTVLLTQFERPPPDDSPTALANERRSNFTGKPSIFQDSAVRTV